MNVKLSALIKFGDFEHLSKDMVHRADGTGFLEMLMFQKASEKLYICLFNQNPKTGYLDEVVYPLYKRVPVERTRGAWTPYQKFNGGFVIVNNNILPFPPVTGRQMVLATHVAVALETGKIVAVGKLDIPALIQLGGRPVIYVEQLKVEL